MAERRRRPARLGVAAGVAAALIAAGAASAVGLSAFGSGPAVGSSPGARGRPAVRVGGPPATTTSAGSPSTTAGVPLAGGTAPDPAAAALQAALGRTLGGNPGCAVAVRGDRVVATVGGGVALAPASTQKLVVGAAALAALGGDHRFVTRVVSAGPVVNGVAPRLWLVGGGDPLLATADYGGFVARSDHYGAAAPITPLEWLTRAVAATGVRAVPYGVAGDDALFSDQRYLPTWKPAYLAEDDVGPLSALSLDEGWKQWHTQLLPAADPAANAAQNLLQQLRADGVQAGGVAPDSVPPPGAEALASVTSAPLWSIVAYMLATSDNHIAELLTRAVGQRLLGRGTTAAGTVAVLDEAAHLGVPMHGAVMVDGSGLSPENRATCAELMAAYRLGTVPGFGGLRSGLPVAGRTGTMYAEFRGTPLAGRVVAKTGWIDGAAAVVGMVSGTRPVDFAFVVNGPFNYAGALAIEQGALLALLSYSDA